MKKNWFYLIASCLVAALVIGLPFAFVQWNEALKDNTTVLVTYIIIKVLFGICLIAFIVLPFVKDMARGHTLFLMGATFFMQFVPLFVRFGLYMGNFALIYSILISVLPLVGYVVFLGLALTSNKKQLASDKKYEGKTIEVVEEKDD